MKQRFGHRNDRFARARHVVVAVAALVLGAWLFAACSPTLREGFYACPTGECPDGWYCRADRLCYRTDGTQKDGGPVVPQLELYRSCVVAPSGNAACRSGLCSPGPDATATTGQCSMPCTGDASCPGAPNALCVDGECVATCRSPNDCEGGLECFRLAMRAEKACFTVVNPNFASGSSCVAQTDCDPLTPCLRDPATAPLGVCSWVCTGTGDACPLGTECVDVGGLHGASPTGFACLASCGKCPSGLTCGKFPSASNRHCVPSGW